MENEDTKHDLKEAQRVLAWLKVKQAEKDLRGTNTPYQIRLRLLELAAETLRGGAGGIGAEEVTVSRVIAEAVRMNAFVSTGEWRALRPGEQAPGTMHETIA